MKNTNGINKNGSEGEDGKDFREIDSSGSGLDSYDEPLDEEVKLSVPGPERGIPSAPDASEGAVDTKQALVTILANPEHAANTLGVTEEQIENLRSLTISFGTGATHKLLKNLLGDVPASALGAIVSSILAKKVIRREY